MNKKIDFFQKLAVILLFVGFIGYNLVLNVYRYRGELKEIVLETGLSAQQKITDIIQVMEKPELLKNK